MDLKRIPAGALALTMTAALGAGALAAGMSEGTAGAPAAAYGAQLFLNGEELDVAALPGVEAGLLPMRLLCEADGGMAEWYEEDNQAFFYLSDHRITVSFADNSVELELETVPGVTATLVNGVTFLPADFVNTLEGVEVSESPEADAGRIDVKTPNGTPIMKLANAVQKAAGVGIGMKASPAELEEFYGESTGFKAEYMTEGAAFLPMMTTPDTLVLGKMAEGKEKELRECFEAYRKAQEETFSWYLTDNLPKVEAAQFVTEGDWFLFLIGENVDEGVKTFQDGVKALAAQ